MEKFVRFVIIFLIGIITGALLFGGSIFGVGRLAHLEDSYQRYLVAERLPLACHVSVSSDRSKWTEAQKKCFASVSEESRRDVKDDEQ